MTYSRLGKKEQDLVHGAVSALASRTSEAAGAEYLALLTKQIELVSDGYIEGAPRAGSALAKYAVEAAGQGPPARGEIGNIPFSSYKARLVSYLNGLLPSDPSRRVREALNAAIATDCQTVYGGTVVGLCSDLGLGQIQWASLWLAFLDLRECKGDLAVLDRYLQVDPGILAAALDRASGFSDEGLVPYAMLLAKWGTKKPSRWEAWADLEDSFAPVLQ